MGQGAFYLLKRRTFLPLFLAQFLGAFNDNAFKLAMLTLVSYFLTTSQTQSEQYQIIASALFIIPFFLFSATAGQLADKYDKARITKVIKVFEVVLMIIGGIAIFFGNIPAMMITLTGLGIHSTFFGPIKYAILPDHLVHNDLLPATALIEASTFLAILLGTTLGTLSVGGVGTGSIYAVLLTLAAASAGLIASLFIPPAPPTETDLHMDWRLWRATHAMIKDILGNKRIMPAILSISWFWLVGGVLLTKLPDYTNYVLHAETTVFAVFLALFSIGIGIGSLTINKILKGKVKLQLVPYALFLLSFFACDLYWASPTVTLDRTLQPLSLFFAQFNHWRIAADLFLLAFCGGVFVVPVYTYIQVVSKSSVRARTIAANNIFNGLFMVAGMILVMALLYFKLSIAEVFLILGLLNVVAASILWFLLFKLKALI